ncbi:hypothetical protein GCM10022291_17190 [Postechiella marina]|uniref:Fibronectin type-III domain-containing protein n=1 Tax=Postechiella marina TaxID=943941 RepID=A0ABP8C907_9FLAO
MTITKKLLLAVTACLCFYFSEAQTSPMQPLSSSTTHGSDWTTTNLTPDQALNFPWEITYGPDNKLWITERVGEKIIRVSTAGTQNTGDIETLIDLSAKIENSKQGGLMGMAIHPDLFNNLNTANNYVYAAYTYNDGAGLQLRIVRLLYNHAQNILEEDTSLDANGTIIEGLPGSEDHNSGRLIIGPDLKLYYTIGDQGANQFTYSCNPILSQVLPTSPTDYSNYPGKTLRLNLDGSIPSDNPVLNNVQSHVFSYGHRNAQGIIFGQDGTLYNSEHGAKVDDEINIVSSGKNYGWPEIAGYYDNLAYTYCNWSSLGGACDANNFSDHNCPSGADTKTEYQSYPTLADVPSNFAPPIGTYGGTVDTDPPGGWFSWPSVAPSSIDIHEANNIPGWGRSLLVSTLKKGTIYRAKLTPKGNDIVGDDDESTIDGYEEFHSSNDRYRDIAISPDGLTIYAVTDNSGGTSGPSSGSGVSIENGGTIVKIEYVGAQVTNPPVANCQDITVTLDADGNATILAEDIDNGSTGGTAGINNIVIDQDTFNCTHIGTQTVWLTVTDNNGNESRCNSTVTIQANANPNPFTAPTLDAIVSNCPITVTAPTLLNNACIEVTATTTDQVTYNPGESGTITWSFDDGTNSDTTTQDVMVNTLDTPSNIAVTPGATTSYLVWDNIDDVSFEVRYRETGNFTWLTETTNANSLTLAGLNTSTTYEYQLRSDCGTFQSSYTALDTFMTTNITYTKPTVSYYPDNFYISNLKLKNSSNIEILNNSSDENDDINGYSDHTTGETIPDLKAGDNFNIDITLVNTHEWNKTTGHSVWIDYNQDGDFLDNNERVWGTTAGNDLFDHGVVAQGSFTVPSETLVTLGNTRMRIASRTYYTPENSIEMAFDNNNGGEYEDYMVNITGEPLSLSKYSVSEFKVYPNPVKDALTIQLPPNYNIKGLKAELYDIQGRVITQKNIINTYTTVENLNNLNKGVYFIKFKNDKGILGTKKLIKL